MALTLMVDRVWESPYVFNAFVALSEKQLVFDIKEIDLAGGEQRAAAYAVASITARVPALIHDGFWLTESNAIVEYLEESFPDSKRLLPKRNPDRARARQILSWLSSDLLPLREERSTATLFFDRATAPLSDAARAAAGKLVRVTEQLLPGDHATLFEEWSIADAALSLMLHRLILNGDPVPERVAKYAARTWQRKSVRDFVERPRPRG
jgi:glutathione S-transferase